MATRSEFLRTVGVVASWAALTLRPCQAKAWSLFDRPSVHGSGKAASEKRTLSPFNQVWFRVPGGEMQVVQGNKEEVTIVADDNILALIETKVSGGELTIAFKDGARVSARHKIEIALNARTVEGLHLAGSAKISAMTLQAIKLETSISGEGDVSLKGLRVDKLSASIAGSGDFSLDGTANVVNVDIAGEGQVHAGTLSAKKVHIEIAGEGDAVFWVHESLSVSVEGSGDVKYFGNGVVAKSSFSGSGSVKHLGRKPTGT